MSTHLVVYSSPDVLLTLTSDTGATFPVSMPAEASIDAAFLATWLYGKSEKTQRAYTSDMHKFYQCLGLSLERVKLEDFHTFIDSLAPLKPASRARAIATIKSALSFGVKTGYLKVNIGTVVKLPKLEDKLAERIMSEQAVARLLALETHTRNHAILALLYRAGLRAHELCNLQWRNLVERDQAGQLAIFGKGKKTRFVLLDEETWQELASLKPAHVSPDTYVFQSRQARSRIGETQHRMDESMIYLIVSRAAKRAGIQGRVSPHWMRHAYATHSIENGAPIPFVKEVLGHASIETTAKYMHVRPNVASGKYLKV